MIGSSVLRVLHVTPYFAPAFVYGGPPRSILGLCKALRDRGIDVSVATTTANGQASELPSAVVEPRPFDGVPARYFPLVEPRWLWRAAGLRAALAAEIDAFDVVHIHGLWHLPGWDAARIARRAGVPYVISPRGMLEPEALAVSRWRKAVAFGLIERRNLQSAAMLHATSTREAGTLADRRFGPAIVLAPNGVDVAQLTSVNPMPTLRQFGLAPGERYVMFLGRIHPIKRLDLFAEAMRRLRTRGVRAVVAGPDEDGHRDRIEPVFDAAGIDVTWTGPVDSAQKADLLSAAAALVVCSDSESFGLVAAEAMAAGTPVVVTRTCPWEEIEKEGAGRWVAQDPAAIADALDDILCDKALARTMGQRGRLLAARRYSWSETARVVAWHYESLANRRGGMALVG